MLTLVPCELKLSPGRFVMGLVNPNQPEQIEPMCTCHGGHESQSAAHGCKIASSNIKEIKDSQRPAAVQGPGVIAARAAHEANRALCSSQGDDSQPPWDDAPQWQKESAMAGVIAIMKDPATTPEGLHEQWVTQKATDGWMHGELKDAEKKTHPCMVPYDELPESQQLKDRLFGSVVRAVLGLPVE